LPSFLCLMPFPLVATDSSEPWFALLDELLIGAIGGGGLGALSWGDFDNRPAYGCNKAAFFLSQPCFVISPTASSWSLILVIYYVEIPNWRSFLTTSAGISDITAN
jgi:hypothetical protein